MGTGAPLIFGTFRSERDPLMELLAEAERDDALTAQLRYLTCYLHDLRAVGIVEEPNYFDRDYLSEYAAFYCTSTPGYSNRCRRVHYFSIPVDRELLTSAAGESSPDPDGDGPTARLQEAYIGHIILRPLRGAPLGRTVLRLYPDREPETPRLMHSARPYFAHVAGITLSVTGIAWQQQDSAVGGCATIALWSMLHSRAFDDHHAIPTTAELTSLAHKAVPVGKRVFPAFDGLDTPQMLEAIKACGLAPICIRDDERGVDEDQTQEGFSRSRFCTLVASFLRSGYPVLVNGFVENAQRGAHSICLVGFRSPKLPSAPDGKCISADTELQYVYVHDDNLGPNVRFKVTDNGGTIELHPEAPPPRSGAWPVTNPTEAAFAITPTELVVAVHQELRTSPLRLQEEAVAVTAWLPNQLRYELKNKSGPDPGGESGMLVSSSFFRLWDYIGNELARLLAERPAEVLAAARLQICEEIDPLSLHVAVVRVTRGTQPVMDLVFDTSDSDAHLAPRAHIAFQEYVPFLATAWVARSGRPLPLGPMVRAW